jgi:hypothetical protein
MSFFISFTPTCSFYFTVAETYCISLPLPQSHEAFSLCISVYHLDTYIHSLSYTHTHTHTPAGMYRLLSRWKNSCCQLSIAAHAFMCTASFLCKLSWLQFFNYCITSWFTQF